MEAAAGKRKAKRRLLPSIILVILVLLALVLQREKILSPRPSLSSESAWPVQEQESDPTLYFAKLNDLAADIYVHSHPTHIVVAHEKVVISCKRDNYGRGTDARGVKCTRNKTKATPGWGNVVLNFAAVQGMALVLSRHAFISHSSISDLFEHPAAPASNVSWQLMTDEGRRQMEENMTLVRRSNRDRSPINRTTSALWRCGMNFKRAGFDTFADALTIGCNMILVAHPDARVAMSKLLDLNLPVALPTARREEAEMIYGHIFKWLFSRPRSVLKADDHLRRITNLCHHRHNQQRRIETPSDVAGRVALDAADSSRVKQTIDVAIQVRTFRDLHGEGYDTEFWDEEGGNYHECAASVLMQTLRRLRSAGRSGHLCVYVTSDYPSVSQKMQRALLHDPRFRGEQLAVVSHAEMHDPKGDWHSGIALKASQVSELYGQGHGSDRKWLEVLDWLAMSSAGAAVMTSDSTFGQTARYRTGYFESRYDYRVESPRNKSRGARLCLPVHDKAQQCALCARLGKRCPLEAQRDCRRRSGDVMYSW